MRRLAATNTDNLTEWLRSLRVSTTVFCRSDMGAPWGFAVKPHGKPAFHVILDGECWVEAEDGGAPVHLRRGDVVILPRGPGHTMRSSSASKVEWLDDILAREPIEHGRLRYGGTGATTDLICGVFDIENGGAGAVLRTMPDVTHVPSTDGQPPGWMTGILDILEAESRAFAPGAESVAARVADIMLIQVMRHVLREGPVLLGAFDARVARALRLLREQPDRSWTVSKLAEATASSRSAFVARFRDATGDPPMRYLSRLRLNIAAGELRGGAATLADIAKRVGYGSDISLSKAFRREFGVAPREYRAAARASVNGAGEAVARSAVPA